MTKLVIPIEDAWEFRVVPSVASSPPGGEVAILVEEWRDGECIDDTMVLAATPSELVTEMTTHSGIPSDAAERFVAEEWDNLKTLAESGRPPLLWRIRNRLRRS